MAAADIISNLDSRVKALEQNAFRESEALQPTYLTVNPSNGQVSATFTGLVNALGLVLTAGGAVVTGQNQIIWRRTSDAATLAFIQAQQATGVGGGIAFQFRATAPDVAGTEAELTLDSQTAPAVVKVRAGFDQRTVVDGNLNSDFLQLASTQKLAFNCGDESGHTWTGLGENHSIAHGLGRVPSCVLVSALDGAAFRNVQSTLAPDSTNIYISASAGAYSVYWAVAG